MRRTGAPLDATAILTSGGAGTLGNEPPRRTEWRCFP